MVMDNGDNGDDRDDDDDDDADGDADDDDVKEGCARLGSRGLVVVAIVLGNCRMHSSSRACLGARDLVVARAWARAT